MSAWWESAISLPVVLCGALVCLAFCFCCARFSDPDFWWHLKLGQEIWQSKSIPVSDHWSFTVNGNAWLPHEWLAQLSFYAAYSLAGYQGVQLQLCLFAAVFTGGMYLLCYRYCAGSPRAHSAAALGGFIAFFFATIGLAPRPQVIGYLLLVVELLILQSAWLSPRQFRSRRLWLLPPLFAIWVNCHASYVLGGEILAVTLLCAYLRERRDGPACGPALQTGLLLLAACGLALLLNPLGIKLLTYPLNVFTKQRTSLGFLAEWLPSTTDDVRGIALLATLGGLGLAGVTGRARLTAYELLLLMPVSLLAIQHLRMLYPFGIIAAPMVSRLVAGTFDRVPAAQPARSGDRLTYAFILTMLPLLCLIVFPSNAKIQQNIESLSPVKAVAFIRSSHLNGPMLNDYAWGGYLIWALPEQKVFIDGRGDVYDWAGILARYRDWSLAEADPTALLDDFGIRLCLLPANAQMAHILPRIAGWKTVYADSVAVVIQREPGGAAHPD